jgi:hypothetical protein
MMAAKSLLGNELAKVEGVSTEVAVPVQETPPPPFVGFFEKNSGKVAELSQAGVALGESYLSADNKLTKLYPLSYHLLNFRQFWTETDENWNILDVTTTPQNYKSKLKEHFEVVLLTYINDTLVPARATFRFTKANAGLIPSKELGAAAKGDWAGKSPEHKEAAKLPEPWARFTATTKTTKKTAKGSGFTFYLANTTTAPTTMGQWNTLQKFLEDTKNKIALADVFTAYNSKVTELLGRVKK